MWEGLAALSPSPPFPAVMGFPGTSGITQAAGFSCPPRGDGSRGVIGHTWEPQPQLSVQKEPTLTMVPPLPSSLHDISIWRTGCHSVVKTGVAWAELLAWE